MPKKTRAEIQKAYRERKKEMDKKYQQKESRRVLKYYRETSKLNEDQQEERRRKNRENQRRSRERKRDLKRNIPEVSAPLIVKLQMPPTHDKRRKVLREKNRKIQSLTERIANLEKANNRIKKRNQRLLKDISKSTATPLPEMTPRSRTTAQLREAGLNLRDKTDDVAKNLRKRLLFSNVLVDEIRASVKKNKSTVGSTSQYRNKTIFAVLANHSVEFAGVSATWNYFEAGHGKGPCDGVGGSSKRMADEAVRNEKVVIDDAQSFFAWATTSNDSSAIKYIFYSKDDVKNSVAKLAQYNDVQSVPGTMKFHAVAAPEATNKILARTTSCYCPACLVNPQDSECKWDPFVLCLPSKSNVQNQLSLKIGDFLATRYDEDWYIGKVENIDQQDGEVKVTFMVRSGSNPQFFRFKWPAREDVLWVARPDILCVIEPPIEEGKTRKSYRLSSATLELIQSRFNIE